MKVRKEWIGSKKPATEGSLAELQEDIHVDMIQMEERLRRDLMDKETGKEMFKLIKSIDKRLHTWEDIPERLTQVENDIFKLKLRR